jgi:hypothetical protein
MITTDKARTLANASHAAYDENPTLTGYTAVNTFEDTNTGFQAMRQERKEEK